MKFLFFMNMASGSNELVHQVVADVPVASLNALHHVLHDKKFVSVSLMFYSRGTAGDKVWVSKGDMLINTALIGKVSIYKEGAAQ